MGSLDGPLTAFNASLSEMALASGDGRVKLFSTSLQRLTADITQALARGAAPGGAAELYSCIAWGAKVCGGGGTGGSGWGGDGDGSAAVFGPTCARMQGGTDWVMGDGAWGGRVAPGGLAEHLT